MPGARRGAVERIDEDPVPVVLVAVAPAAEAGDVAVSLAGQHQASDVASFWGRLFMEPRRSLHPGDLVEVSVGPVGTLSNPVEALVRAAA